MEVTGSRDDQLTGLEVVECFPDDERDRITAAIEEALSTGEATVEAALHIQDERILYEFTGTHLTASDGTLRGLVGIGRDIIDRKDREQQFEQQTEQLAAVTAQLEQQYEYLFEQVPVIAVGTRNQGGIPVIEECNQRFVEKLGYEKLDTVGRELAAFYTPESRTALFNEGGYERALTGEFTQEDRQLITADGEIVETLLRAVPR